MPNSLAAHIIDLIIITVTMVIALLAFKEVRTMEKELDQYHTADTTIVFGYDTIKSELFIVK